MHDVEKRTIAKVYRKFFPLLLTCYLFAFLDRVNIGFAALTMSKDLNFTSTVFGLGAGLFFISYFLLEVPSNMVMARVGARLWIARIMVTWGILSAATAFIWNEWSFYAIRILLGAAEAGFFPGVILFLTYWVPGRYRARIVGSFMVAMPLASVLGAPISGYLLTLDGFLGLRGWQAMFLIEGIPSVLLAFAVLWILRDNPDKAEWLSDEERNWLNTTLQREHAEVAGFKAEHEGKHSFMSILCNPVIILFSVAYFGLVAFNLALNFFLPQIVKSFDLTLVQTGIVSALPMAVAAVGMLWWGRRSDARNERRFHLLFPVACAVIGLGGSTFVTDPVLKLSLLCLGSFGVSAAQPIFWAVSSALMIPAVSAVGVAIINSVGNLSGFSTPFIIGLIKDSTGSFNGGYQVVALFGIVVFFVLGYLVRPNKPSAVDGARVGSEA